MSLSARIMYDEELDELARNGGVEAISFVQNLFKMFPDADFSVILHTASSHISANGVHEYPESLIYPEVEPVEVVEVQKVDEEIEDDNEHEIPDEIDGNYSMLNQSGNKRVDPRETLKRKRRKNTSGKVIESEKNVNFKNIINEFDEINFDQNNS